MKTGAMVLLAAMLCAMLVVPAFAQIANPEAWAEFQRDYVSKMPELKNSSAVLNNPNFLNQHPGLAAFLQKHPNVRAQALQQPNIQAWEKFQNYATSIPALQGNPGLVNDPAFLSKHPQLAAFLQQHPNVRNRANEISSYNRGHGGQNGKWWEGEPYRWQGAPYGYGQGRPQYPGSEGRRAYENYGGENYGGQNYGDEGGRHHRHHDQGEEEAEEHGHHDRGRHLGEQKGHGHDHEHDHDHDHGNGHHHDDD